MNNLFAQRPDHKQLGDLDQIGMADKNNKLSLTDSNLGCQYDVTLTPRPEYLLFYNRIRLNLVLLFQRLANDNKCVIRKDDFDPYPDHIRFRIAIPRELAVEDGIMFLKMESDAVISTVYGHEGIDRYFWETDYQVATVGGQPKPANVEESTFPGSAPTSLEELHNEIEEPKQDEKRPSVT